MSEPTKNIPNIELINQLIDVLGDSTDEEKAIAFILLIARDGAMHQNGDVYELALAVKLFIVLHTMQGLEGGINPN